MRVDKDFVGRAGRALYKKANKRTRSRPKKKTAFQLFDTVKIKETGETGFISCRIEDELYVVNTGTPDNQPVVKPEDLELVE